MVIERHVLCVFGVAVIGSIPARMQEFHFSMYTVYKEMCIQYIKRCVLVTFYIDRIMDRIICNTVFAVLQKGGHYGHCPDPSTWDTGAGHHGKPTHNLLVVAYCTIIALLS